MLLLVLPVVIVTFFALLLSLLVNKKKKLSQQRFKSGEKQKQKQEREKIAKSEAYHKSVAYTPLSPSPSLLLFSLSRHACKNSNNNKKKRFAYYVASTCCFSCCCYCCCCHCYACLLSYFVPCLALSCRCPTTSLPPPFLPVGLKAAKQGK